MSIIFPIMPRVENRNRKQYIIPTTVVCTTDLMSPLCKTNLEIYEENKRKREQMVECWYDDDRIGYYQRQGYAIVNH